jgi:hypothetical protein
MRMDAPGTLLAWILTAIVALPLSPCAFIASADCQIPAKATVEVAQQPARSCCADSTQPAERPSHQEQQKPCAGDCCRLSPFGPTVEKLVHAAPPLVASMVWPHVESSWSGDVVCPAAALEPSLPLHVLHCQWRC